MTSRLWLVPRQSRAILCLLNSISSGICSWDICHEYVISRFQVVSPEISRFPNPRAAHAATGIHLVSVNQWKGWLGVQLHKNSSLEDVSLPVSGVLVSTFGVVAIR
ncbi:hypothetical protein B0T09DRAFT_152885 [Sordaria sp. MPI-SDFR-AT-0083]|nr:hypothetical protein B0T09DRAFT_152885 [Sordaria sp. MPI-SDFR-AT-0083]